MYGDLIADLEFWDILGQDTSGDGFGLLVKIVERRRVFWFEVWYGLDVVVFKVFGEFDVSGGWLSS